MRSVKFQVMFLIEPCCAPKHFPALVKSLGTGGTSWWHGYGDLSLSELLQAILLRCSDTEMLLVAPSLPDMAAEEVAKGLRRRWAKADGTGSVYALSRLTLITDLSEKRSPLASTWLKDNPFGERLMLKNVQQNDTAILLPDLALFGPINLTYGGHFTAIATKNTRTIATLRTQYEALSKR